MSTQKERRRLRHEYSSTSVVRQDRFPAPGEGREGEIAFRETKGVLKQLVKRSGQWKDVSEGAGTQTVIIGGNVSSGSSGSAGAGGFVPTGAVLYADGSQDLEGAWDLDSQALSNVNIDSGDIAAVTISGDNTWSSDQTGVSSLTLADGKSVNLTTGDIVFTPSASDTVTIDAAANGVLNITTVDADAAAANIVVTADGTLDLNSVALDIDASGAVTLDGVGVSIDSSAASNLTTSSGALTITSAAAATWSTAAGVLTISGKTGVTLQEDGGDVITIDTAKDVLFSQTGGSSGDPDVEIDGYFVVDGTSEFNGTVDIDGTVDVDNDTFSVDSSGAISLDSGAASNFTTSDGAITIDASASTVTVDGHTGATVTSSNSGEVDITSAANVDINATTGVTVDGTTLSIDGTDDSNLTVTGSGKDLNLAVVGGGTQQLTLASAGTGANALTIATTAGGIDITSTGSAAGEDIDISTSSSINLTSTEDRLDSIVLLSTLGGIYVTTQGTSGNENINITSSGGVIIDGTIVSIDGTDDSNLTVTASGKDLDIAVAGGSTQELRLASAGTGASAMHLNASAGGINIDSADMIDIDAADEITIDTTSADGHIAITSAHTAGQSILISSNADAGSILDIDAGILDIDAAGVVTIDSSGGTINIGSDDIDQNINIGTQGERVIQIGTGAFESTVSIGNATDATAVYLTSGTGSMALSSTGTGDITINSDDTLLLDSDGVLELNSSAGAINIGDDTVAAKISIGGDKTTRTEVELNAREIDINAGNLGFFLTADRASEIYTTAGNLEVDSQAGNAYFRGNTGVYVTADTGDITLTTTAADGDLIIGSPWFHAGNFDVMIGFVDPAATGQEGRLFGTGHSDQKVNYIWVGMWDIQASAEYDTDFGDW